MYTYPIEAKQLKLLVTNNSLRFQVLTAASMKITAFWDVASCSIVEVPDVSGVYTVSINAMMMAARASETLVYFNKITRRYIPER
jgi:hypothetical protein